MRPEQLPTGARRLALLLLLLLLPPPLLLLPLPLLPLPLLPLPPLPLPPLPLPPLPLPPLLLLPLPLPLLLLLLLLLLVRVCACARACVRVCLSCVPGMCARMMVLYVARTAVWRARRVGEVHITAAHRMAHDRPVVRPQTRDDLALAGVLGFSTPACSQTQSNGTRERKGGGGDQNAKFHGLSCGLRAASTHQRA